MPFEHTDGLAIDCGLTLTQDLVACCARQRGRQREVQFLERRGADLDHPVLLGLSETEYLKCWVLEALRKANDSWPAAQSFYV